MERTGLRLVAGSWKIIEMSFPRRSLSSPGLRVRIFLEPKWTLPPGDFSGGLWNQFKDGKGADGFTASRLADQGHRFSVVQGVADAIDGGYLTLGGRKCDLQVVDGEFGLCHRHVGGWRLSKES